MGHKLVEIHLVRLQCFCPTLNGATPKAIFCHNCGHSFRECGRVKGGCCGLSPRVVSDCRCFAGGTSGIVFY